MSIHTSGFMISRVAIEPTALGGDGLVVYVSSSTRKRGTEVRMQCTQAEFNAAVRMFVGLRASGHTVPTLPGDAKRVVWQEPTGPQAIYINGLQVQQSKNLLFSYNLRGDIKEAQNRDRMVVDWQTVREPVGRALLSVSDPKLLAVLAEAVVSSKAYDDLLQAETYCYREFVMKEAWKKAILAALAARAGTTKICLAGYNEESNLVARDQGYRVFRPTDYDWLYRAVGIEHAGAVAARQPPNKDITVVPLRQLDADERRRLTEVTEILQSAMSRKLPKVRVFAACQSNPTATGLYARGTIYLHRALLRGDGYECLQQRLAVLFHEVAHRRGGKDRTREFEADQDQQAAEAILRLLGRGRESHRADLMVGSGVRGEKIISSFLGPDMEVDITTETKSDIEDIPWWPVKVRLNIQERYSRDCGDDNDAWFYGRNSKDNEVLLQVRVRKFKTRRPKLTAYVYRFQQLLRNGQSLDISPMPDSEKTAAFGGDK